MRKKLTALIIIIVLLGGAAIFASPYLTLKHIKDAANQRDATAISAYVDYPAVRASLRNSMRDAMQKKMGAQPDNPLASFALSVGGWVSDRMVDAFVTPDNIAALMRGEDWSPVARSSPSPSEQPSPENTSPTHDNGTAAPAQSAGTAQSGEASQSDGKRAETQTAYRDFNHFVVRVHRRDQPDKIVTFVLTRQDLIHWKLTAIELPAT